MLCVSTADTHMRVHSPYTAAGAGRLWLWSSLRGQGGRRSAPSAPAPPPSALTWRLLGPWVTWRAHRPWQRCPVRACGAGALLSLLVPLLRIWQMGRRTPSPLRLPAARTPAHPHFPSFPLPLPALPLPAAGPPEGCYFTLASSQHPTPLAFPLLGLLSPCLQAPWRDATSRLPMCGAARRSSAPASWCSRTAGACSQTPPCSASRVGGCSYLWQLRVAGGVILLDCCHGQAAAAAQVEHCNVWLGNMQVAC